LILKELYTELSLYEQEFLKPLLVIDDENIRINRNNERCIIDVSDKEYKKCPFSLILHTHDKKISLYVDNDIMIFNYEDYLVDSDFRLWVSDSIYFLLCSNIIIKKYFIKNKIKKRLVYISCYEENPNFDYPITAMNGLIWFWEKKYIKESIKKYNNWITPIK